jgi:methylmalonyl-CoA/ethylmalonyl-CoA epimerase
VFADKVLGEVLQWGYLVKDLDQAMDCWIEQLGIGPWWGYRNVPLKSLVDGRETDIKIDVGLAYHQGVQIELIHQTCDSDSPYSYFYRESEDAQVLQQVAYMVPNLNVAIGQCQGRGMHEIGRIIPGPGADCVYMSSPAMKGIAVELMPFDQGFLDEYKRCAEQAEQWDGTEPYRLISL